jgi:glycosyltransferase involved in cell wall biosynthesis
MRIAFVSDAAFPWHVGGLEAIERVEAKALAKSHDVHFFTMLWPGMGGRHFTIDNIHYHAFSKISIDRFYRHGRRSIGAALRFSIGMLRIFRYRFDVIECNMFPVLHIPIIKLYCKLTGCKMILDVVEIWERRYWLDYLGGFLGRLAYAYATYFVGSADTYIANSTVTADKLVKEGVGRDRISVFAPILDDAKIKGMLGEREKKKGGGSDRIVFSGRMIKEKRLDKWLAVVKETRKKVPSAKGLIIGDGPEKESTERMIKSMSLEKAVEHRDFYKNQEDTYRAILDSALFLHMSEREGLSIITLESLMLGVPVVLPSYSPMPDEVRRMCIVRDEAEVPKVVAEILRSGNRSAYLKNLNGLKSFFISGTEAFYDRLFKKLGLR